MRLVVRGLKTLLRREFLTRVKDHPRVRNTLGAATLVLSLVMAANSLIVFRNTTLPSLAAGAETPPAWALEMQTRMDAALSARCGQAGGSLNLGAIARQVRHSEFEAGVKALEEYRYQDALDHFNASFSRDLDPAGGLARANFEGEVLLSLGRLDGAADRYQEAVSLARSLADKRSEAGASSGLGQLYSLKGQPVEARENLERALALAREVGDREAEARALYALGESNMHRHEQT